MHAGSPEGNRGCVYQRTALLYLVVGFAAAIGVILLCLFNIAVFPKDGIKAEDWQVTVALLGVGVTVRRACCWCSRRGTRQGRHARC
jgi:hypothetical protein